jgi:hypothetical protein
MQALKVFAFFPGLAAAAFEAQISRFVAIVWFAENLYLALNVAPSLCGALVIIYDEQNSTKMEELEFWVSRKVVLTQEERLARGIAPDEDVIGSYKMMKVKASQITNRDKVIRVA